MGDVFPCLSIIHCWTGHPQHGVMFSHVCPSSTVGQDTPSMGDVFPYLSIIHCWTAHPQHGVMCSPVHPSTVVRQDTQARGDVFSCPSINHCWTGHPQHGVMSSPVLLLLDHPVEHPIWALQARYPRELVGGY